jgi:hypothetical protein
MYVCFVFLVFFFFFFLNFNFVFLNVFSIMFREFFRIHRIGFMIFDVLDQTSVVHHQESVCEK